MGWGFVLRPKLGRMAESLHSPAGLGRFGTYAIVAFLVLLSVEVAGALFAFWETGTWVYAARPSAAAKSDDGIQVRSARRPAEAFATFAARLHPYFGFAGPYEG